MGVNPCDDGNTINGDGCDENCEIEDGYECYSQRNGPDICRNEKPLIAMLKVEPGNILKIIFNKDVKILSKILYKL